MHLELEEGGIERLDDIRPLWERLNRLHADVTPHFQADFKAYAFEDRKQYLESKNTLGEVRVFQITDAGHGVGFCIASLRRDLHGEIESIYIMDKYRGAKLGDRLMRAALTWMDTNGALTKSVNVVYGNEQAFPFYAKYGFLPRSTTLLQT